MKKKCFFLIISLCAISLYSFAQDTTKYKLRLSLPLVDLPKNYSLPYYTPSMQQSLELSNDFYELSIWGIDALGDKIFIQKSKEYTKGRKIGNAIFKYAASLAFSKYGSELPIPLGVWGHEEFHRSVLGTGNISLKNSNWIFNRWDGTVYGISDETLTQVKSENLDNLLYSYVAGVQYEIALNQKTTINDFYKRRTYPKNALLLYNAYYVYNYFSFSTSAISDSVKVLAPPHESKIPTERDYAGADLTAWVYDMFNPSEPYNARDPFPGGDGVNRRIGYSDLTSEAQSFLEKQKNLSLLNFINPAIFFVNRIKVNNNFSLNLFTQYSPTHFGNDMAVFIPAKYNEFDMLLGLHKYANQSSSGFGIVTGLYNYKLSGRWESDITLNFWSQPKTFFDNTKINGGQINLSAKYNFKNNFAGYVSVSGKTKGWTISNPYLKENVSMQVGINYNLWY
ncbi:MAG TPA: hypothetical protein PKG63_04300 [Bacteroidales bacterium]|nr:hypothetical protein [Bacteroidales bacterium]